MATNLTQEQRILALLRAQAGEWVPLPMILGLGIAQYNARIHALRRKGHKIENRSCWVDRSVNSWSSKTSGAERHSYFRLVLPKPHTGISPVGRTRIQPQPTRSAVAGSTSRTTTAPQQLSLLESVAHVD